VGASWIQGANLRLLHWQEDPLPLSHQGSPPLSLISSFAPEKSAVICIWLFFFFFWWDGAGEGAYFWNPSLYSCVLKLHSGLSQCGYFFNLLALKQTLPIEKSTSFRAEKRFCLILISSFSGTLRRISYNLDLFSNHLTLFLWFFVFCSVSDR